MSSPRAGGASSRWLSAAAGALRALSTASAWAQNVAGRFLTVIGEVRVLSPSGDRQPERDGEIREGETILTGAGALTQIRLADGGMLSIRGDTEMRFDRFSHTGENDRGSSMFIALVKGGFRSVTGLIGRLNRDGYRVTTPSATIGIRGTDHEPVVAPAPPPGVVPQVPPGTYDRVYSGETFIQNRQGITQNIGPNQVGFISIQGAAPAILPQLPPIYRAGVAPAPAASQGQPSTPGGGAPKSGPAPPGGDGSAGARQLDPSARRRKGRRRDDTARCAGDVPGRADDAFAADCPRTSNVADPADGSDPDCADSNRAGPGRADADRAGTQDRANRTDRTDRTDKMTTACLRR